MAEYPWRTSVGGLVSVIVIGITACGGSVTRSASGTVFARTAGTAHDGKPARMRELAACLRKGGVTSFGTPHSINMGDVVGKDGLRQSKSLALERYAAALRKCRGSVDLGRGFHPVGATQERPGDGANSK